MSNLVNRLITGSVLTCVLFATPLSAEIYKWTDAQGNVHFGERPPNKNSAQEIKVKNTKAKIAPAEATAEPTADVEVREGKLSPEQIAERDARLTREHARRCKDSKRIMKQYDEYRRSYYTDENGNEAILPEEKTPRTHCRSEKGRRRILQLDAGSTRRIIRRIILIPINHWHRVAARCVDCRSTCFRD